MKYRTLKLQMGCFVVLLMVWTLQWIFGLLNGDFVRSHFIKIYAVFVVVMAFCKMTMKAFAAKLDGLRIGNGSERTMSFEYLCEFYCGAMYWILWRQLIVYHVVFHDEPHRWKFMVVLAVHCVMELVSCLGRSSDFYFDHTNDLLHDLDQRTGRIWQWMYRALRDDSNVYQWRTRLAFDLMVRVSVCLVTAIMQQIYLALSVPSIYSTVYTDFVDAFDRGFDDSMLIEATIYNVSTVGIELVLYGLTMWLFYRWYWINVWQSFQNMVSPTVGKKVLLMYWVICVVSVY